MRLFAGIPVPSELRQRAAQVLGKCARSGADVRWVRPANLHLTVRFFGETAEDVLPRLKEALAAAARTREPFSLELGGYGAFPEVERPRVLFVPVLRGGESLAALAEAVLRGTEDLGFPPPGEEFHPHLTLGRVRSRRPSDDSLRELHQVAPARLGRMRVASLHLFESMLSAKGPEYRHLDEFPLGPELL
jgi:2'-5' RNA ligase